MKRTARPPVEAPRMVFTMARATTLPSSGPEMLPFRRGNIIIHHTGDNKLMLTWEPPLKARNPKIRINPPRPARGTE